MVLFIWNEKMTTPNIYQQIENDNYNAVMRGTWGHLAPEHRKVYHGEILFAFGEYGDIIPIRCNFEGLPDSPWFYDQMTDFIAEKSKDKGTIYRFEGTYMLFKNGKCRFSGKVNKVKV